MEYTNQLIKILDKLHIYPLKIAVKFNIFLFANNNKNFTYFLIITIKYNIELHSNNKNNM